MLTLPLGLGGRWSPLGTRAEQEVTGLFREGSGRSRQE